MGKSEVFFLKMRSLIKWKNRANLSHFSAIETTTAKWKQQKLWKNSMNRWIAKIFQGHTYMFTLFIIWNWKKRLHKPKHNPCTNKNILLSQEVSFKSNQKHNSSDKEHREGTWTSFSAKVKRKVQVFFTRCEKHFERDKTK